MVASSTAFKSDIVMATKIIVFHTLIAAYYVPIATILFMLVLSKHKLCNFADFDDLIIIFYLHYYSPNSFDHTLPLTFNLINVVYIVLQ